MVKIVFLIRSLDFGGAERQLVTLVLGMNKDLFDVSVLCLYGGGPLKAELNAHNIQVTSLEKGGRWDIFPFLRRLIMELRAANPHILHSYLEVPNILTACLKPLLPAARTVLGVRSSFMDAGQYDWLYRVILLLESACYRFADLIIVNSHTGKLLCKQRGFPEKKMVVIPNGIDTTRFFPHHQTGSPLRAVWNIPENCLLIGLVGRIDPMKDHKNFLQAAALVANSCPNTMFVCVGDGEPTYTTTMVEFSRTLGLEEQLIWAGAHSDMPAVYNALDICCNSSIGEGFSNVIGEAMACSVPCVVTDVGDSTIITGDTGIVVPPSDPTALAGALINMLNESEEKRQSRGALARQRILSDFNVQRMVKETETTLLNLLTGETAV